MWVFISFAIPVSLIAYVVILEEESEFMIDKPSLSDTDDYAVESKINTTNNNDNPSTGGGDTKINNNTQTTTDKYGETNYNPFTSFPCLCVLCYVVLCCVVLCCVVLWFKITCKITCKNHMTCLWNMAWTEYQQRISFLDC